MEKGECTIYEKGGSKKIIAAMLMTKNRMFPLRLERCFSAHSVAARKCTIVQQQVAFKTIIQDPFKLRHLKYGHLGYVGLNIFSKKGMVGFYEP